MSIDLVLPDLGEGIKSGIVTRVLVSVGDALAVEQPVIEMETDKAVFEVPSSVEGIVEEIFVRDGDEVKVGGRILSVTGEGTRSEKRAGVGESEEKEADAGEPVTPVPQAIKESKPAGQGGEDLSRRSNGNDDRTVPPLHPESGTAAPAAPSVRRFAREIGVNIDEVPGSGPGGRISIDDVKIYSKQLHQERAGTARGHGKPPESLPDFSKWGSIERTAMSGIRRKTAEHLAAAWNSVPHVTHFDSADISKLEELRAQYKDKSEAAGGKLTVTALLVKIAAGALKTFPQFNASIDMDNNEIIYKKYYNIGVAVDTDRGLLVPVIRDVTCKNIIDISAELTRLSEKARNKTISLDEMRGGCFTISNLGGIGGTGFTPIVNSPEVAILGVSRSRMEPVYVGPSFEPRLMMPLTLSYDHRIIDGADAARFMRWMVEAIENPLLVMMEG
jgi:pyruvate dehydrogenase E2 component (dihydrolipoamide acetyltransferase)